MYQSDEFRQIDTPPYLRQRSNMRPVCRDSIDVPCACVLLFVLTVVRMVGQGCVTIPG